MNGLDQSRVPILLESLMRQQHTPGEKAFIDWAGATIPIYDRHSSAIRQASLFVAVLGASSYTYAEVTRDQQMQSRIRAYQHAFAFWTRRHETEF